MPERVFRIAVIPGDGIGNEVVPVGLQVMEALQAQSNGQFGFEFEWFPWGCQYYLEHGEMMAADGLDRLRDFDAIYFGAVGWPEVPDHIALWGLRLAICQGFDQYACVRPTKLLPGIASPLSSGSPETIDFVVVRENSEGEYAGIGGRNLGARGADREVAVQSALFTSLGCERIIRYAFELARTRSRKKLTSVTKSNAQQYAMTLWDDTFARVALDYPDIETESILVDAMAAKMVLRPETFDVIVASNLFGDILSDLGGAIAGSLGISASTNIDPERRYPSMFEPVHGSAPDIAGQNIANPIAAVWSAALMLDFLGLTAESERIMRAIAWTTENGPHTPDLGGVATTKAVGDAIVDALERDRE